MLQGIKQFRKTRPATFCFEIGNTFNDSSSCHLLHIGCNQYACNIRHVQECNLWAQSQSNATNADWKWLLHDEIHWKHCRPIEIICQNLINKFHVRPTRAIFHYCALRSLMTRGESSSTITEVSESKRDSIVQYLEMTLTNIDIFSIDNIFYISHIPINRRFATFFSLSPHAIAYYANYDREKNHD